ncbi:DUF922 domain-containing Zn-dependent protease [Rhodobacter sp. KR11]|uniref:DUF922 domain-containing Zn-dependent protease n=1 Tax=Rhodobacter sp. KR11 TaxID=2974588 RepID=UPI002221E4D8|nr:DUF922 domain-containing Zn-dependent protease [Rhodobacter sp. KR11]MCW1919678.1 DUF922 domain-containing Zn-dependent protease [Rhodobacter sp. KR11]
MARRALLSGLWLALMPSLGLADIFDQADITLTPYQVSGSSLDEVSAAMSDQGPQGYWAYTTWNASWDGQCQTAVTASITLPELSDDADLDETQVAEFDRMAKALLDHELGHVQFGLDFAAAVAAAGCPSDTDAILADHARAEKDYDAQTEHGWSQGVYLEEP